MTFDPRTMVKESPRESLSPSTLTPTIGRVTMETCRDQSDLRGTGGEEYSFS